MLIANNKGVKKFGINKQYDYFKSFFKMSYYAIMGGPGYPHKRKLVRDLNGDVLSPRSNLSKVKKIKVLDYMIGIPPAKQIL